MKRLAIGAMIFLSFCLFAPSVYAAGSTSSTDKYAITVKQADDLEVSGSIVTLTGNVILSLKTSSDQSARQKDRELLAQKIVFNLDEKLLQASGDVTLREDSSTSFYGDAISLGWETLDVVVFGGGSSSNKKNSAGSSVNLRTIGNRVSYEGDTKTVFFEKGAISTNHAGGFATRADDMYWSINASKIGMANSDLFLKNATFRIGRVPFFWLPFFFYPGVQLSINPAMGISSDKGMFLNTTYEVYGKYPRLGTSGGTRTSSDQSETESSAQQGAQAAFGVFSMIASGDNTEMIRDGLYYKPISEVQQSTVEQWARKTGSYLAVFGDAYEDKGVSVGLETRNKTETGAMQMEALGVLAYRHKNLEYEYYDRVRYSLDLNLNLDVDRTHLKFVVPIYSDPNVKRDFLNRNTVFGLDAVFGQEQTFPTTYNSSVDDYRMTLTGSTGIKMGNTVLNISGIDAYIKYKWLPGSSSSTPRSKDAWVYEVTEAKLPGFNLGFSGTVFDWKASSRTVPNYQSDLARALDEEYAARTEYKGAEPEYMDSGLGKSEAAPPFSSTRTLTGPSLKLSYSYSQTVNNFYSRKMKHSYLSTSINPSIRLEGGTGRGLLSFTETIAPMYSGNLREGDYSNSSLTLRQTLAVSSPLLGLSYNLSTNVFMYTNKNAERDSRWGEWDNKDVLAHNIVFSKKIKDFTVGAKQTLKPLTESFAPSISYAAYGISASASTTFTFDGRHFMDATTSNGRISYGNNYVSASFSNSLNHRLDGWEGYSGSQTLVLYPFYKIGKNRDIHFNESLSFEKEMEAKNFSWSAWYKNNYIQMNYSGADFDKETMKVRLLYTLLPKYWWRHRMGIESTLDTSFTYDFKNEYGSSFNMSFTMNFAINRFIDMRVNVSSQNNSFHLYYDNDHKFQFNKLWEDLKNSFDFFGDGRKSSHFTLNSMSIALVHYMEDWNLTFEAKSTIETVNGKKQFKPEISVSVKWNAIPELKTETKYDEESKTWVKK